MSGIYPIPSGRSSDLLVQQRILSQLSSDQSDILRLQSQLSTGRRVLSPSEDVPASVRAMGIQRLLEQQEQTRTNVSTSESYLSATDTAIASVSNILIDVRGHAVAAADDIDFDRQAASQAVQASLGQLLDIANRQFRGRYLFAGSETTTPPYEHNKSVVAYNGNENRLPAYADIDLLFDSNVAGAELFGGLSAEVRGAVDFNPRLTENTRLSDLRGGAGVSEGSIEISDGQSTSVVDLRGVETLGDIVKKIEANPPEGRQVDVEIADTGLVIRLDAAGGGTLTVSDVSAGVTAKELGVAVEAAPSLEIVGSDLNPRLRKTDRLENVLTTIGEPIDLQSGLEITNAGETHVITFEDAETVEDVLNILNAAEAGVLAEIDASGTGINIRSRISGGDFHIGENGGQTAAHLGVRSLTRQTPLAQLNRGSGVTLAEGTDFVIRRTDGVELEIDLSSAATIGDALDIINQHPDNQDADSAVTARLAAFGNGVEIIDANLNGTQPLGITPTPPSRAAADLGLIPGDHFDLFEAEAGLPAVLSGEDVHPVEASGVFNTLLRLDDAILRGDNAELQRISSLLEDDIAQASFARAELGTRLQSLDVLNARLDAEEVELRSTLSDEIEADLAETISELTARQASLQASLQQMGYLFRQTLLDYI